jgi:hypothetical protein
LCWPTDRPTTWQAKRDRPGGGGDRRDGVEPSPERTIEVRESSMSETHKWQQLGGKQAAASGGADSEARRASDGDAGDHGGHRDHEHDEEAPRSFLLILLRALGAMHT